MRTVKLQFFERDGEWGAAPVDMINSDNNSFDPFWHGIGIFHDVFEHHFEYKNPYFQGEYVQNVAGEIAATGATVYFNHILELSTRLGMALSGWGKMSLMGLFRQSGEMMADTILKGKVKFGKELSTALPEQPLTDYDFIERLAQFHLDTIDTAEFKYSLFDELVDNKKVISKTYKESITLDKLQRLYRWGYTEAQKEVPNTPENRATLKEFIELWEVISRVNPAEDIATIYKYLEFTVEPGPILKWDAKLITEGGSEIPYDKALILNSEEFFTVRKDLHKTLKAEEKMRRAQAMARQQFSKLLARFSSL